MAKGSQIRILGMPPELPLKIRATRACDHPRMNLVYHALAGTSNNTWNPATTMALTAKNKLVFVDDRSVLPSNEDLLYGSWPRCNTMVISWILNSVNREIDDSLMYFSTENEINKAMVLESSKWKNF